MQSRPWLERQTKLEGWIGYRDALAITVLCASLSWALYPLLVNANLGLLLLTGALMSAIRGGVGPALFASALSFLLFNFLFTEPRFSFHVTERQDFLTLAFYLLIVVVTGLLAARIRRQMKSIRSSNQRIVLLQKFSRALTGLVSQRELASMLVEHIRSTLGVQAVVHGADAVSNTRCNLSLAASPDAPSAHEIKWVMRNEEPAGRGTTVFPQLDCLLLPILGRSECLAVLGVHQLDGNSWLDRGQYEQLLAIRDLAGIALDRLSLTAQLERDRLLMETERLRSALLSSVSHDLRTPLVSIKGAASALLELGDALDSNDRKELLHNLLDETERLDRHVQNLLEMTRIGHGAVTLNLDWCDVRDVMAAATRGLKTQLTGRAVEVVIHGDAMLVHTDSRLLQQVITNLLENAAKYSPAESPIVMRGELINSMYEISVSDHGPGIPLAERERVFDMFHRVNATDQRAFGTGLGLAICKGLVEGMGGTIEALDTKESPGACLTMRLPQPESASSFDEVDK